MKMQELRAAQARTDEAIAEARRSVDCLDHPAENGIDEGTKTERNSYGGQPPPQGMKNGADETNPISGVLPTGASVGELAAAYFRKNPPLGRAPAPPGSGG